MNCEGAKTFYECFTNKMLNRTSDEFLIEGNNKYWCKTVYIRCFTWMLATIITWYPQVCHSKVKYFLIYFVCLQVVGHNMDNWTILLQIPQTDYQIHITYQRSALHLVIAVHLKNEENKIYWHQPFMYLNLNQMYK